MDSLSGNYLLEALDQLLRAVKLLLLLMQKSGRHGRNRAAKLYEELARNPSHQVAAAQLAAVFKLAEVLFKGRRGAAMMRRLVNCSALPRPSGRERYPGSLAQKMR
jgi:hypothetical protein